MQSKNKNVRNELPPRYRRYCELKRHLGEQGERKIFPLRRTDSEIDELQKQEQEIIQLNKPKHSNDRVYDKKGLSPTLNTAQGGNRQPFLYNPFDDKYNKISKTLNTGCGSPTTKNGQLVIKPAISNASKREFKWQTERSPALCARDYKEPKVVAIPVLTPDRLKKRQAGRRFKKDGDPAFTLTAQDKHGVMVGMQWRRTKKGKEARKENQKNGRDYTPFSDGHRELVPKPNKPIGTITSQAIAKDSLVGNYHRIRRLVPIECERLQGFPRNFTKYGINDKEETVEISDTQRYKTLGNAITTNVIKAIMTELLKIT